MNPAMADGAVLILGLGQGMTGRGQLNTVTLTAEIASTVVAFQTKREHLWPLKQACVHTAVGDMAGAAAIHTDSGVLKHERPPFVDMTLHARFFVLEGMGHHARAGTHLNGWGIGTVWIVAV